MEHRTFKTSTNKEVEIATLGSNYHIECNPSDAGNSDKFVIQEVIKEIASHSTLQSRNDNSSGVNRSFKVVILTEVDRLSKQAQAGLRRTMEKYSSQCRIILICNSPSKIIEPVRSRCLGIRIPAASVEEIAGILMDVARKVSMNCSRNIRRAILMLETCKVQQSIPPAIANNANPSQPKPPGAAVALIPPIAVPDWELYIAKIAKDILSEQSPNKLLAVRDMLYELLTNCIPCDVIMTTLVRELYKSLDDQLKHEVAYWAAYYEHRMRLGSKEIFHLEAFVAKFMALYKRWLVSIFG